MAKFVTRNGQVRIWGLRSYKKGSTIRVDLIDAKAEMINQLEDLTKMGYLVPKEFEKEEIEKGFDKEFEEYLKIGDKKIKEEKEKAKEYIKALQSTGNPREDNSKITVKKVEALKGGIRK
jgi:hypothetical protein